MTEMPLPEVHVGQEDMNNLHGDTGTYSFHLMNESNQSPGQAFRHLKLGGAQVRRAQHMAPSCLQMRRRPKHVS